MDLMKAIDGNKTYIMAIIAGIFTVIHFMITSDYSMTSFIQLAQDGSIVAMIAALRHGVQKVQDGNKGIVTMATMITEPPMTTGGK